MLTHIRLAVPVLTLPLLIAALLGLLPPAADAADGIDSDANAALNALYDSTPAAKTLAQTAKGILIFPNIVKAGFLVGAQYGEGELLQAGKPVAYYNIAAVSYGFQAGVQGFAYSMFFMTDSALNYLDNTAGFEIGAGPSIVVVDAGMARSLTTTTGRNDVYAFIFGQKGLMAGIGLQGSKITKIGR
jgi:lipid-binding SYLF domain-containing protein